MVTPSTEPEELGPSISDAPSAQQLARRIRNVSIAAALSLIAFAAAAVWWDYRVTVEQTQRQLSTLAAMEKQQMTGLLTAADQAIRRVSDRMRGRDLRDVWSSKEDWQALRDVADGLPFVINFVVVDENARIVLGRNVFPSTKADVSYREYFTAHRDGRDLMIGRTIFAEGSRHFTFTVSRAMRDENGNFKGAVVLGLSADYLSTLLGVGLSYPSEAFSIVRNDGALIARYPLQAEDIKRSYANAPIAKQVRTARSGTYDSVSPLDGQVKLAAFETLDEVPLYTIASVTKSEALAPWRNRLAIIVTLVAAILVGGSVMYRSLQRSMAAEADGQLALGRANEQLSQLIRELDHRARNLLTVVHGMVRLGQGNDLKSYRDELEGRLTALANAQSLLAESHWTGADLENLARRELAAFQKGHTSRVTISGTPLTWAARSAQPMAIVLHELATNAVKYGALSVPDGALSISWELHRNPGLVLHWHESGLSGLSVPARKGFGSQVIEQTIRNQLGGTVSFTWNADGLDCRIELPPDSLIANEVAFGRKA